MLRRQLRRRRALAGADIGISAYSRRRTRSRAAWAGTRALLGRRLDPGGLHIKDDFVRCASGASTAAQLFAGVVALLTEVGSAFWERMFQTTFKRKNSAQASQHLSILAARLVGSDKAVIGRTIATHAP